MLEMLRGSKPGIFNMRIEMERRSSSATRRFAISTDETMWPTTGIGMKTSSPFFIVFSLLLYVIICYTWHIEARHIYIFIFAGAHTKLF